jgi:hypothetical protein
MLGHIGSLYHGHAHICQETDPQAYKNHIEDPSRTPCAAHLNSVYTSVPGTSWHSNSKGCWGTVL